MKTLIAQGAEAKIYRDAEIIIKERIKKNYRIAEIDTPLRVQRTRHEASLLARCTRVGVPVPKVLEIDEKNASMHIELIDGPRIRDYLTESNSEKVCEQIGRLVAKMHAADVIHSDLTTSNMIIKNEQVYFIDFGLGEVSSRVESKAVDLHLFKECLNSKHHAIAKPAWEAFERGYENENKEQAKQVLERLMVVEARGRYKHLG